MDIIYTILIAIGLILLIPILWFVLFILIDYLYLVYIKKVPVKKLSKEDYKKVMFNKPPFMKRLFIDFPKQYTHDLINTDPYRFKEYGLHMFVGEQGTGKTISAVELIMRLQQKYPKMKVRTNMAYAHEDGELQTWKQLINDDNGEHGMVEMIDEIQTWWSSKDSGNMPAEMLGNISQQRKKAKMLIGTAQVYSRIAKEIREQTLYVYCPVTLFGCLTIVRVTKPQYWDNENQLFKQYIKTYFFVHSDKLRNSYDTYKCIERYKEAGFNDRVVMSDTNTVINIDDNFFKK